MMELVNELVNELRLAAESDGVWTPNLGTALVSLAPVSELIGAIVFLLWLLA